MLNNWTELQEALNYGYVFTWKKIDQKKKKEDTSSLTSDSRLILFKCRCSSRFFFLSSLCSYYMYHTKQRHYFHEFELQSQFPFEFQHKIRRNREIIKKNFSESYNYVDYFRKNIYDTFFTIVFRITFVFFCRRQACQCYCGR